LLLGGSIQLHETIDSGIDQGYSASHRTNGLSHDDKLLAQSAVGGLIATYWHRVWERPPDTSGIAHC
jgi:hypothetical protein